MMSESLWEVSVRDGSIVCQNPHGETKAIQLADIVSVKIETDDSGPWESDVWWMISSRTEAITFPSGAQGEHAVLAELQKLTDFDNNAVTRAMCSSEPNTFVCLSRLSHPQPPA